VRKDFVSSPSRPPTTRLPHSSLRWRCSACRRRSPRRRTFFDFCVRAFASAPAEAGSGSRSNTKRSAPLPFALGFAGLTTPAINGKRGRRRLGGRPQPPLPLSRRANMKYVRHSPMAALPASGRGFSSPVRTGEKITKSGTWRSECAREGCRAVELLSLYEAALGPPCIRCCNPTILYFVGPLPVPAEQAREGTLAGPHHFTTRHISARFGEITLTWPRGAPGESAPDPPPPTESVHSARGSAAAARASEKKAP
jgi:hypothetical protein